MRIFSKNINIRKVLKVGFVIIVLLLIFPLFILINRVRNDYPLREYMKETFIDQLMDDMSLYTSKIPDNSIVVSSFYIEISDSSLANIENQRDERISMLLSGEVQEMGSGQWEYVKAKAIYNDETFNIELRLRGDMPSNYNKSIEESTMRFNVKKGKALNGKKKLSLIRPALESGYYGYLFYKCFNDLNFLANDIQFVKLYFNGEYAGLRFLQEGFSKELLESSLKREGPILRFKNDCVDEQGRYNPHNYPELVAYGEKKTLKDSAHSLTYARALNKYDELIKGNIGVSSCFNIEEYARFYALSDIFLSHHCNKCQNVKLYFNPINDKFEPIAWDPNNFDRYENPLNIEKGHTQRFGEICHDQASYPIHYILSKNDEFLHYYSKYLKTYSQDGFILNLINQYSDIISSTERDLFRQNFQERFNSDKVKSNLAKINQDFKQKELLYGNYYINEHTLSIRSISNLPVAIDSIIYRGQTIHLDWVLAPNVQAEKVIPIDSISSIGKKVKIYSRILNTSEIYKYKAKVFTRKDAISSNFFNEKFDRSYFDFSEQENSFRLKNKFMVLTKDLFIPDIGMTWIIEPGTNIIFDNASIVCESSINAKGLEENKINFSSITNGGILIKNNPTTSYFSHTIFTNLTAPSQDNWNLTGAVSFYNSLVELESCSFNHARSEDALNLVSCEFNLNNIIINDCASDALDIDFGKGLISNISVEKAKNDGLDFSGSNIQLKNVVLKQIGDKAISAGESSKIDCNNVNISDVYIGLASKDSSVLQTEVLSISNSKIDFTAYQKKPEYDVAKIVIRKSNIQSPKSYIEKGSLLIIDDKTIQGDKVDVYSNLYSE